MLRGDSSPEVGPDAEHGDLRLKQGLIVVAVTGVSVALYYFREQIAGIAAIGYPFIFLACFLLNSGVFGLSPSGVVAVQMSYVYDPAIVVLLAGLGAGLGELTSFFAGKGTTSLAPSKLVECVEPMGWMGLLALSFVASFVSGNLSDALGVACGWCGKSAIPFVVGATLAKLLKMFLLVCVSRGAIELAVPLLRGE